MLNRLKLNLRQFIKAKLTVDNNIAPPIGMQILTANLFNIVLIGGALFYLYGV